MHNVIYVFMKTTVHGLSAHIILVVETRTMNVIDVLTKNNENDTEYRCAKVNLILIKSTRLQYTRHPMIRPLPY